MSLMHKTHFKHHLPPSITWFLISSSDPPVYLDPPFYSVPKSNLRGTMSKLFFGEREVQNCTNRAKIAQNWAKTLSIQTARQFTVVPRTKWTMLKVCIFSVFKRKTKWYSLWLKQQQYVQRYVLEVHAATTVVWLGSVSRRISSSCSNNNNVWFGSVSSTC